MSMRKLTFIKSDNLFKKLMIYTSPDTIYLFLYDSVDDRPCVADLTFHTLEDAHIHCLKMYDIKTNDWICISDPSIDCQYDLIVPTRVKNRKPVDLKWGPFQYTNGKWVDISPPEKYLSFAGMSKSLCLLVSGLLHEFELSKRTNQSKARKILASLGLPVDLCLYFGAL